MALGQALTLTAALLLQSRECELTEDQIRTVCDAVRRHSHS